MINVNPKWFNIQRLSHSQSLAPAEKSDADASSSPECEAAEGTLLHGTLYFRGLKLDSGNIHTFEDVDSRIHRPWAAVIVKRAGSSLSVQVGRDEFGRCGLLYALNPSGTVLNISVMADTDHDWQDVPVDCFQHWTFHGTLWTLRQIPRMTSARLAVPQDPLDRSPRTDDTVLSTAQLLHILESACRTQCVSEMGAVPSEAGVMFSGGLDSTVLAALLSRIGVKTINLYNVSFDGFNSPDRLTGLMSHSVLTRAYPDTRFNLILRNVDKGEVDQTNTIVRDLIRPEATIMDLNIGTALYFACQRRGCLLKDDSLAFMGFRDLNDMEAFAAKIDHLLENQKLTQKANQTEKQVCQPCCMPSCVYRAKANCVNGCCKFCCGKQNNHCDAHFGRQTPEDAQKNLVCQMERLWTKEKPYEWTECADPATILVSGNGADELFGGYGRYRTAYMHHGESGWRSEMTLDLNRLWKRNLGRDDRCGLGAGAYRVVHPFLHPHLVHLLARIVCTECLLGKGTDFHMDSKALLRCLASQELRLSSVCHFRKRAIQFGSRIANVALQTSKRAVKGIDKI